ncbi:MULTISPECIES: riboflavin synthase [Haloferax]|uniref:Riboflavin synthase n=2 Tax=Haloferax TaxID=2251 RepID=A0A6G1YZ43_9EURY|nr:MULTISPECIES: riboflavin synthase [Haloferax]KAB1186785.1 riboflavin synthase [Haloferax sp. CBA1149]MRW79411.1 riboflavin synthase [Haloferax marinisediminis]
MFTGIVEGPGEIVGVTDTASGFSAGEITSDDSSDGGRRLRIRTDLEFDDLHHGQSIAVSGVCLTVEEFGDDWFEVFLAAETVEKTYLGEVGEGDRVNLERALAASDRFDGHIVQGHVDGTTTVSNVEQVGDDWFFEFDLPESLAKYVVQKGSVCLDGISLTVADRRDDSFAVAIIPTTYDLTTLSEKDPGDPIHVEVDVVAKYVESMLDGYVDGLRAE